jgi:hypothetical protein
MAATKQQKTTKKDWAPEKGERAMIEGILEGSPDAVGVAVIRLNCGCRKMAAVTKSGEPASKIIAYRDKAETICDQCKKDHGDFMRVTEQFISWMKPEPEDSIKNEIIAKVLGTSENQTN